MGSEFLSFVYSEDKEKVETFLQTMKTGKII
jgi:hypothetical protein